MLKDWALALGVGLAVFLLVQFVSTRATLTEGAAPPFELVNVAGGTTKLEDFRGKVVVVNFWGTWCPPCRKEIPEFSAYAKEHPEVPLLGVAVRSGSGSALAKSAEKLGINYTVLESSEEVLDDWGISVFPTTYVIDASGQIARVYTGGITRRQLASGVEAAR